MPEYFDVMDPEAAPVPLQNAPSAAERDFEQWAQESEERPAKRLSVIPEERPIEDRRTLDIQALQRQIEGSFRAGKGSTTGDDIAAVFVKTPDALAD